MHAQKKEREKTPQRHIKRTTTVVRLPELPTRLECEHHQQFIFPFPSCSSYSWPPDAAKQHRVEKLGNKHFFKTSLICPSLDFNTAPTNTTPKYITGLFFCSTSVSYTRKQHLDFIMSGLMAEWVQVPTGEKSGMWALERKERESGRKSSTTHLHLPSSTEYNTL